MTSGVGWFASPGFKLLRDRDEFFSHTGAFSVPRGSLGEGTPWFYVPT